jgi:CheY-like chemotaxis protein
MKLRQSEFDSENDVTIAAGTGNLKALEILALVEELGFTSSPPALRASRARELWKKAADLGSPVAALSLGYMLEKGLGGKKDLQLAEAHFIKARSGGFLRKQDLKNSAFEHALFSKPTKILVLDASEQDFLALSGLLASKKCEVHHVKQGKDALELLAKQPGFNLIFCELNLPIMGGIEFLKRLRSSHYASIPVVIYSSDSSKENIAAVKNVRVSGWLLKPASKEKIVDLMTRLNKSSKAS